MYPGVVLVNFYSTGNKEKTPPLSERNQGSPSKDQSGLLGSGTKEQPHQILCEKDFQSCVPYPAEIQSREMVEKIPFWASKFFETSPRYVKLQFWGFPRNFWQRFSPEVRGSMKKEEDMGSRRKPRTSNREQHPNFPHSSFSVQSEPERQREKSSSNPIGLLMYLKGKVH